MLALLLCLDEDASSFLYTCSLSPELIVADAMELSMMTATLSRTGHGPSIRMRQDACLLKPVLQKIDADQTLVSQG